LSARAILATVDAVSLRLPEAGEVCSAKLVFAYATTRVKLAIAVSAGIFLW
jgi:hypothetical protein